MERTKNKQAQHAHNELTIIATNKTKTKKIAKNSTGTLCKQQDIYKLSSVDDKKIIEIRLGMLDIIVNFKEKYKNNLACQLCQKEEETFQHLFECKKYSVKIQLKADFSPEQIWKLFCYNQEYCENINLDKS